MSPCSLKLANTEALALLQIHWPVTEPQQRGANIVAGIRDTWAAMERLVDQVRCTLYPLPCGWLAPAGAGKTLLQGMHVPELKRVIID